MRKESYPKCRTQLTTRIHNSQEQILHTYTDLLISRWSDAIAAGNGSAEIDVMRWFNFLTFDIFGELAFTESFDCLRKSEYHGWISLIFEQLKYTGAMGAVRFYPLLESLLAKMIPPSLQKAKQNHAQMIVDKVQRRLDRVVDRADFMSNALLEGEGKKTRMPIGVINSTFSEFAVAASDTTAMALSAAVNLLVWNEEKMRRLVKEVRERFQGYEEITVQGVRDMEYLNAAFQEVLRLCPPVPWNPPRVVPEGGAMVCGRVLPGGVSVPFPFSRSGFFALPFPAVSNFLVGLAQFLIRDIDPRLVNVHCDAPGAQLLPRPSLLLARALAT
jgi:cytochrome P450